MKLSFKKVITFISSLTAFSLAAVVLSTVAWFVGAPKIESQIDSNIKRIAGYFDSNTADENGDTEGNGDGTAANPFVISRPNHLHNLMRLYNDTSSTSAFTLLNGKYIEVGKILDSTSTKKVYKYTNTGDIVPNTYDINLNMAMYADSFRPIGHSTSNPFNSILKGNGITIENLTVSKGGKTGSFNYFGFIGYTNSSSPSVENLNFSNLTINSETAGAWTGFYAGSAANSNLFKNCKVKDGTIVNGTTSIVSNYGFYGNTSGTSAGAGTADSLTMSSSDITNTTTNLFDEISYDHIATRTDYSQTTGTVDVNTPFSNAVGPDGTLKDGYALSTAGHVVSDTSQLKYGPDAQHLTSFNPDAIKSDSMPTGSSPDGHYFYEDDGDYKYSVVTGQSSPAATWNTFIISGISNSSTYYLYVDTNDHLLKATTTAPGSYSSTPNYYFAFINSGGTNISEITENSFIAKMYSPSLGMYAMAYSNTYKFFYNSGYHGSPNSFGFQKGTNKIIQNLGISSSGAVTNNPETFFSFTANNGDTPIFNRRENEAGANIATATTLTMTCSTGSGDGADISTSTSSSSLFSSGSSYVTGVTAVSKGYYGGTSGIKLGTRADAGSLTLSLHSSAQVKASSIIVNAKLYSTKAATLNVNSVGAKSLTSSSANYTYSLNSSNTLTSITLASSKYVWISSISIVYESNIPVTGVTVNPTSKSLSVDQTQQLTATVSPDDATDPSVSWTTSAPSVATVSTTGLVTAVGPGSATITVTTTDGSFTATCAITVYAKATLNSMTITHAANKTVFTKGDSFSYTGLAVTGSVTSQGVTSDRSLTAGTHYKVVAPALDTIGQKQAVIENLESSDWPGTTAGSVTTSYNIEVVNPASISLSGSDSVTHYAAINISAAAADYVGNIGWSLSDDTKGTLSNASNSGVTFTADKVASGTVSIIAKVYNAAGDFVQATKTITINPLGVASVAFNEALKTNGITLTEGESYTTPLTGSLTFTSTDGVHQPDNKNVTFSLTNLDPSSGGFATIDASDGTITTSGAGTATILVTTQDGGYTDSISLTVNEMAGIPSITADSGNIYEVFKAEEADFYGTCENTTTITWDLTDPDGTVTHPEDLSDPSDGIVMVAFTPTKRGVYTLTCNPSNSARSGDPVSFSYHVLDLDNLTCTGATSSFYVGDSFNYTGLNVVANFSDGASHTQTINVTSSITAANVVAPSSLVNNGTCTTAGVDNVTVNYTDSTHTRSTGSGTYSISVLNVDVTSFDVQVSGNGMSSKTGINNLTLLESDTKTLTVQNIAPANATQPFAISWSTTSSSVVSLSSSSGTSTVITAAGEGTATITVSVAAVGQTVAPHIPATYSISITVIDSISASQHYEDAKPYIGESLISTSNVYWSKDGGTTWIQLSDIIDPNPQFYKVGNVWYVTIARYSPGDTFDTKYVPVTSMSDIASGDKIIMVSSRNTFNWNTPSEGALAEPDLPMTKYLASGSDGAYGFGSTAITYSGANILRTTAQSFDTIEFDAVINSDNTLSLKWDDEYFGVEHTSASKNMDHLASINDCSKFTAEFKSDGTCLMKTVDRTGNYFWIIQHWASYNNVSQANVTNFNENVTTQNYPNIYSPRMFVCKKLPSTEFDFIGDNVINSSNINPITRGQSSPNACRFDIIGATNGPIMTQSSISISNSASVSYNAASTISGKLNPTVNLKNTILMYIPTNTAKDLGTIHIKYDTIGSSAPKFVNKNGSLISASNFFNNDVGIASGNLYLSISTVNIGDIAYAQVDTVGNKVSSGGAFYVIALTAPASGTTLFKDIEFTRAGVVTGNNNDFSKNSTAVPFTFAFNSNNIDEIRLAYNSVRSEYMLRFSNKAAGTVTYSIVNYNASLFSILVSSNGGLSYTPMTSAICSYNAIRT